MSEQSVFDHLSTYATDFERTRDFYCAALSPLGIRLVTETTACDGNERVCAFGSGQRGQFWVIESSVAYTPRHLAFRAVSRQHVDQFYMAALTAGGTDNGAPGIRPHYHADYYGAFVIDPDGNDIEAVFHGGP